VGKGKFSQMSLLSNASWFFTYLLFSTLCTADFIRIRFYDSWSSLTIYFCWC
jgi:hypothetical protein